MIGRRGLLQALVAAPAVGLTIPAKADFQSGVVPSAEWQHDFERITQSVPQVYHPWLPIQPLYNVPGQIHALHTVRRERVPEPTKMLGPFDLARHYGGAQHRVALQIRMHVISDQNLRFDATRYGLLNLEGHVLAEVFSKEPRRPDMGRSIHRVIAVGNNMAKANRRGRARVLLVHNDDLQALITLPTASGGTVQWTPIPGMGMKCGNWQMAGILDGMYEVWTGSSDSWKRGFTVAAYRASVMDFPLIVAGHESGYYVHRLDTEGEEPARTAGLEDYMQAIPITEATV